LRTWINRSTIAVQCPAPLPHGEPRGREERSRRPAAIFKVGDLVGTPSREGWIGEVVDISRLGNGFVTVRWRTPSGISLQSMEERVDYLVLLPPSIDRVSRRNG
jgi:hypothetical protein